MSRRARWTRPPWIGSALTTTRGFCQVTWPSAQTSRGTVVVLERPLLDRQAAGGAEPDRRRSSAHPSAWPGVIRWISASAPTTIARAMTDSLPQIRLHNSLTRRVEPLEPLEPGRVGRLHLRQHGLQVRPHRQPADVPVRRPPASDAGVPRLRGALREEHHRRRAHAQRRPRLDRDRTPTRSSWPPRRRARRRPRSPSSTPPPGWRTRRCSTSCRSTSCRRRPSTSARWSR